MYLYFSVKTSHQSTQFWLSGSFFVCCL